jgi:hypothetical protein
MSTCNLQNGGRRRTRYYGGKMHKYHKKTHKGRGSHMYGGEDEMTMDSTTVTEPVAASAPLPSDAVDTPSATPSPASGPSILPASSSGNPTWEDRKSQGSALVEKGREQAKKAGEAFSGFTQSVGEGARNIGSSITGFFSRSPQSGGSSDIMNELPYADSNGMPMSYQEGGRKHRKKLRKSRRKSRKSRRKARKSRRRK